MKEQITKIGMVAGALLIAGSAFAATDGLDKLQERAHNLSDDMKAALSIGDYDAFVESADGTRAENITEDRFEKKSEFYQAVESGDKDKLAELKAEREENKEQRKENKEARKAAITSGDYDAFVTLTPEGRDTPSEEVFGLIGDLHEAKEVGDADAVTEIKSELSELGFEKTKHKRGHKGGDRNGDKGPRGENK